ncbi:phenylacetate--CoA ligase family protein [Dickeya fangzhongdai]|uniref:phenylacetate--CoA ligase family protein n=1 Tax=Dickeya fangzhongdai TaxID=1778540 RepID=UPI0026DF082D|nr:AMP-binding protein [Dickeya fangzhongdai]WKV52730.1 AMP-binding protein [Dickeya fangzhongdai]
MYAVFKPDLMRKAQCIYEEHLRFECGEITLPVLLEHQKKQLISTLDYVTNHSLFYKKHFAGLTADDVSKFSLEKISSLPFTTKDDLRKNGRLLPSAPLHECWVYYETTGTTGSPTPCPRNEVDSLHNNTPLIIRYREIFNQHGEQHVVGVMGPSELHSTGDTFEDVLRSLGHSVVKMWPRSPVVGMKRVMALIEELHITALVCTPAVAISIARHMKSANISPADTSVKLILTLGELTTPALLRNIGEVWNAKVYNCMYASQESSILAVCAYDSELYTVPLNNFYEVIDPYTGIAVDTTGEQITGELVITHLYKGQKPLVRYRTGDMVRAKSMPDGSLKLIPIGRVRDTLELNGVRFFAWDIENALLEKLVGCLDYSIQIDNCDGKDCLNITVEMMDKNPAEHDVLARVRHHMEEQLKVRVSLVEGDMSAITSTSAMVSWKAARLHDVRPEGDNADRNAAMMLLQGGFR